MLYFARSCNNDNMNVNQSIIINVSYNNQKNRSASNFVDILFLILLKKSPETLKTLSDSTYSRIPIFQGNIDQIIGEVHIRDLLSNLYSSNGVNLHSLLHPIPYVSENMAHDKDS